MSGHSDASLQCRSQPTLPKFFPKLEY
jgi:hypothetical protein